MTKLKRLIGVFSILFVFGCSSTIKINPEKCIMYRTGKRAHLKHDTHMERVPPVMAWNKNNGYNLFVLERHHMKCEY